MSYEDGKKLKILREMPTRSWQKKLPIIWDWNWGKPL